MQFLCQHVRLITSPPSHHEEAYFAPTLRQIWGTLGFSPQKVGNVAGLILVQKCTKMRQFYGRTNSGPNFRPKGFKPSSMAR